MLGVSYIAGSLVALPLLLFKKKGKKEHLAFGPFLAIGTLVVLIWGDQILRILI
jgi:leader peptidase (prepilin peptidase)/N-methyltransferase